MREVPRIGMEASRTLVVDDTNRVVFADERMPAVLSTPWVVAHLEYAARDAIAPCLEPHERSVGVHVDLRHTAATPMGFTVTCRARVILARGRNVTFQIEAHDGVEVIAKGIHKRRVIDVDAFAERVRAKARRV